jgi:hypothetical protein
LNLRSTIFDAAKRGDSGVAVLARLPDVTGQLSKLPAHASRAAAAGFVSYRFDSAQSAPPGLRSTDRAANAAPHMLRRPAGAVRRDESPILPQSNPFAIPRTSLQDAIAPIINFLLLFVLFTAAGTWILSTRRQAEPADAAEPPRTAVQQPLERQMLEPQSEEIEQPVAAPTAAGPLGSHAPRTGLRIKNSSDAPIGNSQSSTAPASFRPRGAAENSGLSPQSAALDVQDTAGAAPSCDPPAVARLSGSILAAPAQQAHHDDNQPGLH